MSQGNALQSLGKSGFSFSFLSPDTSRNTLDLLCVALAKLASRDDPVIVESWRALERQFEAGKQAGYQQGYAEGLAAADAVLLVESEIDRISKRSHP